MTRYEARYSIVTPVFMGGARHQAELRPPAIKGALRFWWRALAWGAFNGNLHRIGAAEARLFGSADQAVGQSRVVLRVRPLSGEATVDGDGLGRRGSGIRYLTYGLGEQKATDKGPGRPARHSLPWRDLSVSLTYRPRAPSGPDDAAGRDDALAANLLDDSLKMLGLLGGLGARARRGFGSLSLLSLERDGETLFTAPESIAAYGEALRGVLTAHAADSDLPEPPYTAVHPGTRIHAVSADTNALTVLDDIGWAMQYHRSWGQKDNGNPDKRMLNYKGPNSGHPGRKSIPSKQRYAADHDWYSKYKNLGRSVAAEGLEGLVPPARIVFGLPHNYGKLPAFQQSPDTNDDPARRASPLHIHIQRLKADLYVGVVTIFRAKFLPQDQLYVSRDKQDDNRSRNKHRSMETAAVPLSHSDSPEAFWQPLHDFIADFKDREYRREISDRFRKPAEQGHAWPVPIFPAERS